MPRLMSVSHTEQAEHRKLGALGWWYEAHGREFTGPTNAERAGSSPDDPNDISKWICAGKPRWWFHHPPSRHERTLIIFVGPFNVRLWWRR